MARRSAVERDTMARIVRGRGYARFRFENRSGVCVRFRTVKGGNIYRIPVGDGVRYAECGFCDRTMVHACKRSGLACSCHCGGFFGRSWPPSSALYSPVASVAGVFRRIPPERIGCARACARAIFCGAARLYIWSCVFSVLHNVDGRIRLSRSVGFP